MNLDKMTVVLWMNYGKIQTLTTWPQLMPLTLNMNVFGRQKNEENKCSLDIWSFGLTLPPRRCHLLAKYKPIFQLLVQQHSEHDD